MPLSSLRLSLSFGILAVMIADLQAAERETASQRVHSGTLLIIAHRGNSSVAPENTLPSFQSALDAKADLIELDYYHSSDGVPVVFHDKTIERTTDARRVLGPSKQRIADLPLADLRRLDAGSWFDAKFAGTKVPTLDEALDLIQTGSFTLIEQKGGDAETCVALLRKRSEIEQVVVQSFDWDYLRACHRLEPRLMIGALGDKELTSKRLMDLTDTGASVVGWNEKYIGAREIAMIHAAGKKAWVYTVNDAARARDLAAAGIDGIITDRPAEIRSALASP